MRRCWGGSGALGSTSSQPARGPGPPAGSEAAAAPHGGRAIPFCALLGRAGPGCPYMYLAVGAHRRLASVPRRGEASGAAGRAALPSPGSHARLPSPWVGAPTPGLSDRLALGPVSPLWDSVLVALCLVCTSTIVPGVAVTVFLPLFCFVLRLRKAVVMSLIVPELIVCIFLCILFKHLCAFPLLRLDLMEQKQRCALLWWSSCSPGYDRCGT